MCRVLLICGTDFTTCAPPGPRHDQRLVPGRARDFEEPSGSAVVMAWNMGPKWQALGGSRWRGSGCVWKRLVWSAQRGDRLEVTAARGG
jgi:hypothetical protein